MRCEICNKEKLELSSGIYENHLVRACDDCIKMENITIIHKPTAEQLAQANKRYTVKERMMHLSGLDKLHPVSKDHEIAQRHLAKIRIPAKKDETQELVQNYDWNIRMARRRKKLSTKQIAEQINTSQETIDNIERGILPKNFEKIMLDLEKLLEIKILSQHQREIIFRRPEKVKTEQDIIQSVKNRIEGKTIQEDDDEEIDFMSDEVEKIDDLETQEIEELKKDIERKKVLDKLEKQESGNEIKQGTFNFSDKKKLQNLTLSDLAELKKQREQKNN